MANAKQIDTSLVTQQEALERIGIATRATVVEYTSDDAPMPIIGEYNPNGQRTGGDATAASFDVRVTVLDRENRKGILRNTVAVNGSKIHDVHAVVVALFKGNIIDIYSYPDNAQRAGIGSAAVERATFESVVTRKGTYWGERARAIVDKIPLLQWRPDETHGAVISLSPAGIKWVKDVLKPDAVVLQWQRVLDAVKETKEPVEKFKYTCLCESEGKPRKIVVDFNLDATCNICETVYALA